MKRDSSLCSRNSPPATTHATQRTAARRTLARASSNEEPNAAPSQWARRLARVVGAKFGVQMSPNHANNRGEFGARSVVIKCAKSTMPPVSVLASMLNDLDELWAVFVLPSGRAEVWTIPIAQVEKYAYQTRGPKVQKRLEITRRRILNRGQLLGILEVDEVEACRIP